MNFNESNIIGFVSSSDLEASLIFYTDTLGLNLVSSDEYSIEYNVNGTTLRITKVTEVAQVDYTVLGWEVRGIRSTVSELTKKGIKFVFYDGMDQDESGICVFPNGGKVAWFKDPDGNTLSVTQC